MFHYCLWNVSCVSHFDWIVVSNKITKIAKFDIFHVPGNQV